MSVKNCSSLTSFVETWINGWSLARQVAAPVKEEDGFRVDVGWPQQVVRYVFPGISKRFIQLSKEISEPWHFLKVCASPEDVRLVLPPNWIIQPVGFMMTCTKPMTPTKLHLPKGYRLEYIVDQPVKVVKVLSSHQDQAAIGRVVFVNNYAIYDRIETHPDHRRLGLGSSVMKAIESIAAAHNVTKGVLVATAQGKALYETLGWQLNSLYTTAVIPAPPLQ